MQDHSKDALVDDVMQYARGKLSKSPGMIIIARENDDGNPVVSIAIGLEPWKVLYIISSIVRSIADRIGKNKTEVLLSLLSTGERYLDVENMNKVPDEGEGK